MKIPRLSRSYIALLVYQEAGRVDVQDAILKTRVLEFLFKSLDGSPEVKFVRDELDSI